ncbi:MAG: 50S ribosomal protein L6 [Planctomycetes bacterium GWC2_49_10]|nr:MAG: 50S ribosomal protein L6 [Planctomycetes bacterium GWC2_49_10]
MSRIGKKPVEISKNVKVELQGKKIKVSGPVGNLEWEAPAEISVKVDGTNIVVENTNLASRSARAMHGTTRALIANMVTGAGVGFTRNMEIFGTGYNVKDQGGKLVFSIGFSHPVEMPLPKGVKAKIEVPATKGNEVPAKFSLVGPDKHILGQYCANLRAIRPPEPYKGKGIRYADEIVRRKSGKAFASGS